MPYVTGRSRRRWLTAVAAAAAVRLVTPQQIASVQRCALETVKSHLKAVKARYEAHGDAVYTRTDMLRVALRDHHVGQDRYVHGQ
jgi:hypothetical protein